ncbi:hypothetical protein GGX14DRAFT_401824, partial [Mycena pura]
TSRRDAELLHKKAIDAHSAALNAAAAAGSTLPPQLVAWLDVPTTRHIPAKFNYSGLTAEQKAKMKANNHTTNRRIYDAEDSFYNNNIREALTEVSRIDLAGNNIFHSSRSDNMTWTMLHQTLVDQKVRIVGFPSHMTIPTLAGYLRAPPAHDAGDEAFWRSSGGEALLAVTGSGLLYSSVYDLRASSSPTSNAGLVYDGRPKTKRKLPLELVSSSQEQPDNDDVEEIEERPAESEEEEAAVSKKRKAKGTAAGGGRQKPNAAKGKSRATSCQPKAKRMVDDKDPDITESEVDVEPEPPARTTRSRSRPAATPAAAAPVPAPEPAPGQTGGGPPRGRSQTGNVLPRPVARVKRQVAVSPEEPPAMSGMDGNVASSATHAVEDETSQGLKKAVRFADDAAQAKRGPDGSTPQPPNKRRQAADETSTTPTAPVTLHSTATPAPHMGLAALISGATPPLPPVAFPGASSSVGLPGLPPGMPPPSRVPAPPFAAASVSTPPSSGVDQTVQAMSQLMATLSDEQRVQFLQQMGFGAR